MSGDLLGGRYRLVGTLGQGGAAEVYDGVDVTIQRPVAIKVLLPVHRGLSDVRQRLLREGHLGALLGHPHVCGVSDIGALADGSPFLVMERLTGTTVGERLATSGPLPFSLAIAFAEQILSALSAAHVHGIIHRDVKPANVFMATVNGLAPLAKLLDFGAALCPSTLVPVRPNQPGVATQLTAAGMVVGTPHYMAPEHAEGRRDVDARADLYQVGVFLYEALSGKRPCDAPTYAELLGRIVRGDIVPIEEAMPGLPRGIGAVITRSLATFREARFQSADEMLEALQGARHQTTSSAQHPDSAEWEPPTEVHVKGRQAASQVPPDTGVTQPVRPRDRIR